MKNDKRQNCFSWDETFMQICHVIAERSKDPNTNVGTCIVGQDNILSGLGYNGFPRGCSDDDLPWGRDGDLHDTKYAYVVHAEANALLNTHTDTRGAKMYSTMFPCNECAKIAVQRGIKEVVYKNDIYHDDARWIAARRIFDLAGVKYRQYQPEHELIFKKRDL